MDFFLYSKFGQMILAVVVFPAATAGAVILTRELVPTAPHRPNPAGPLPGSGAQGGPLPGGTPPGGPFPGGPFPGGHGQS